MDSESSTPQGAAASATDAFSLTQAAVTAFQSEFQSFQPSKMQVSKLVEEEGLGTLLESLTLQDQASVSRQAADEESLPCRNRVRCVACSLNLSGSRPPPPEELVSMKWVRRVRQRDDDSDSDTTHEWTHPELARQSDSDGDDEPDDDSVTHDSMPELESHSNDEADDDSVTHESMPELARQSDDEREPNDDDNEDQVPQSLNVLPIHQQIGTVIQEMGYVPCGDLNEVDTTTEDDEEEDECEVQTEPKVQTEPILIGHDE